MEIKQINGKTVYIVEHHHEVLEAWNLNLKYNVITLDTHTDTKICLENYIARKNIAQNKKHDNYHSERDRIIHDFNTGTLSIEEIIKMLKNDEHIDFSVMSNIVKDVFVIAYSQSQRNENVYSGPVINYNSQRIIEYSKLHDFTYEVEHMDYVGIRVTALSDILQNAISELKEIKPQILEKYILDIDLDYINTLYAFHEDLTLLKKLIKGAHCITIAKEPDCVESLRDSFLSEHSKEKHDSKYSLENYNGKILLEKLLNVIEQS